MKIHVPSVKPQGQAFQIEGRMYLVKDEQLWRLNASENLDREGSYTFIGPLPPNWTEALLIPAINGYEDLQAWGKAKA